VRPHLILPLLAAFAGCTVAPSPRAPDYDLVIRHGRVLDGTGAPAIAADVAIRDGRIAAVGTVTGTGRQEIDAAGRIVAPGFIDVHTHCEDIEDNPPAENFLRMGVTTIVTGNCGSSVTDVGAFFAALQRAPVGVNVATLVAQGSVREKAMGGNFKRAPTAAETDRMRALVEQAMRDGAVGLSTGLIYVPGTYSSTAEIVDLAKIAARHGGIYASHMRHENAQIVGAIEEMLTVAREAHIRAELSHIKLSGPAAWGRADEIIALLNRARADGIQVTEDEYVYTAASTGIGSNLIDAEFREGSAAQFRERLADPATKARMIAAMKNDVARNQRGDLSYAVIVDFKPDRRLNGKTIPQAAKLLRGSDTLDDQIETVLDIQARGGAGGVFHGMNEGDLRTFLVQPLTMIASDSGVRKFGEGVPHPRGYGNNARVLGHYVRDLKLLTLEDAVRKMTSLPAHTFALNGRGELKPGFVGDLVVFDPDKVADLSTYDDPHHYSVGFSDVIVNGVPTIRSGQLTGAKSGKPVKLNE
jgi:N-acyl-D-amino-acid deacylase